MSPRRKNARRRQPRDGRLLDELIASNVYTALRDESYTLISRLVDESLKDPKLREKIHRLTREILKHIAERI
ncbi:MAG: hypothetical protein HY721_23830 [Planctomycetes bacterium]|nr:hypothetical protein [Planctomycetota bacterium]